MKYFRLNTLLNLGVFASSIFYVSSTRNSNSSELRSSYINIDNFQCPKAKQLAAILNQDNITDINGLALKAVAQQPQISTEVIALTMKAIIASLVCIETHKSQNFGVSTDLIRELLRHNFIINNRAAYESYSSVFTNEETKKSFEFINDFNNLVMNCFEPNTESSQHITQINKLMGHSNSISDISQFQTFIKKVVGKKFAMLPKEFMEQENKIMKESKLLLGNMVCALAMALPCQYPMQELNGETRDLINALLECKDSNSFRQLLDTALPKMPLEQRSYLITLYDKSMQLAPSLDCNLADIYYVISQVKGMDDHRLQVHKELIQKVTPRKLMDARDTLQSITGNTKYPINERIIISIESQYEGVNNTLKDMIRIIKTPKKISEEDMVTVKRYVENIETFETLAVNLLDEKDKEEVLEKIQQLSSKAKELLQVSERSVATPTFTDSYEERSTTTVLPERNKNEVEVISTEERIKSTPNTRTADQHITDEFLATTGTYQNTPRFKESSVYSADERNARVSTIINNAPEGRPLITEKQYVSRDAYSDNPSSSGDIYSSDIYAGYDKSVEDKSIIDEGESVQGEVISDNIQAGQIGNAAGVVGLAAAGAVIYNTALGTNASPQTDDES